MIMIYNYITNNFWTIHCICMAIVVSIAFLKILLLDNSSMEFLIFFYLLIAFTPVINFIFICIFFGNRIYLYLKKSNIKKEEKLRLKKESIQLQYDNLKNALIISGYFKNDDEISDFIDGVNVAQKLSGN